MALAHEQNYMSTTSPRGDCSFSNTFKGVLCFLLATTAAASFVENVMFCLIVYLNKKLHKRANILIVSLSFVDLIISITIPIIEIIYIYEYPRWSPGSLGTNLQNGLWCFSLVAPFVMVTAITVDRYFAVSATAKYRAFATPKLILVSTVGIWAYCLLWTLAMVFTFTPAPNNYYVWNVHEKLYYAFMVLHIIVPLFIIPLLYYKIVIVARQSRQAVENQGSTSTRLKYEIKLSKTIAFVICFLYIVWLPVVALEIVYNFDFSACTVKQAGVVSVWLTCTNGILNPIVYSYRNADFQQYVKNIFKMISCKRAQEENRV